MRCWPGTPDRQGATSPEDRPVSTRASETSRQRLLDDITRLIARHRVLDDLAHRQDTGRREVIEDLQRRQNVVDLQRHVRDLHPADLAYVLESLPRDSRRLIWDDLAVAQAADVLLERQGMAELEIMLPILWSEGVATGRLSVARFVDAFFSRFPEFQKPARHSKWKEANLSATLRGWKRFAAAEEWLAKNPERQASAGPVAIDPAIVRAQAANQQPFATFPQEQLAHSTHRLRKRVDVQGRAVKMGQIARVLVNGPGIAGISIVLQCSLRLGTVAYTSVVYLIPWAKELKRLD